VNTGRVFGGYSTPPLPPYWTAIRARRANRKRRLAGRRRRRRLWVPWRHWPSMSRSPAPPPSSWKPAGRWYIALTSCVFSVQEVRITSSFALALPTGPQKSQWRRSLSCRRGLSRALPALLSSSHTERSDWLEEREGEGGACIHVVTMEMKGEIVQTQPPQNSLSLSLCLAHSPSPSPFLSLFLSLYLSLQMTDRKWEWFLRLLVLLP